jgi:predicted helicase
LQTEFEDFLPIGSKDAKSGGGDAIFENYSRGAETTRDAWAYNFDVYVLEKNIRRFSETYNIEVERWHNRIDRNVNLDRFVATDDAKIKWSSSLKSFLQQYKKVQFSDEKIFKATYRPFTTLNLFFDEVLTHRQGQFPSFFPSPVAKNKLICLTDRGSEKPFMVMMTDQITDLHIVGAGCSAQCFPFYTYDADGSNRRENITDWALAQFQAVYSSQPVSLSASQPDGSPQSSIENRQSSITKWHIFHYVYALLHHPTYRETYAANLRRELPRIPFVQPEHFWPFVRAGERLAEIHVNYESQPQYPLTTLENPDLPLDYRVEKMRLSKDKTTLKYNDFLTLGGLPPQVFAYKLGNRSALDWVIDQYQVSTDARSGITNDPNNPDDETYILRLIKQVITVSLETVEIVNGLPQLEIVTSEQ